MSDQSPSKNPPPRVIAIDGPAGCGKSTVVRLLVERLEAHGATALSFSTGLVYRALTWCALERELDPSDRGSVRAMVEEVSLRIIEADGGLRVEVAGVDPGAALHSTRVTESIHWIADDPEVRAAVLPLQCQASQCRYIRPNHSAIPSSSSCGSYWAIGRSSRS